MTHPGEPSSAHGYHIASPAPRRSVFWYCGLMTTLFAISLSGACRPRSWGRATSGPPTSSGPSLTLQDSSQAAEQAKMKEELVARLKLLVKEATVLKLVAAPDAPTEPGTDTHFGGLPYAEEGDKWPVCTTCKKPLSFICQLNMKDRKDADPPSSGLYTVFYCWKCSPDDPSMLRRGEWLVKCYPHPKKKAAIKLKDKSDKATRTKSCTVEYRLVDSLPDWEGLGTRDPELMLAWLFNTGPEPGEAYEEEREKLIKHKEKEAVSQIGGYPVWILFDSTPLCGVCNKPKALLVQIKSEEAAGLKWGDSGSVYFFVCPEHSATVDLFMQCQEKEPESAVEPVSAARILAPCQAG
ncbi:MAG TPA: DUF1963 domain-containing protein [Phycisphaerae bacterium]|nr:DUF1963 domain-containing protein [Phycisphaerae bacterium]